MEIAANHKKKVNAGMSKANDIFALFDQLNKNKEKVQKKQQEYA